MSDKEFKPMTFMEADERAREECSRLEVDVYIYRRKNGRFRTTTDRRTIPFDAQIHTTISPASKVTPPKPVEISHEFVSDEKGSSRCAFYAHGTRCGLKEDEHPDKPVEAGQHPIPERCQWSMLAVGQCRKADDHDGHHDYGPDPTPPSWQSRAEVAEAKVESLTEELGIHQRTMKFWEESYLAEHGHWGNCKFRLQVESLEQQLAETKMALDECFIVMSGKEGCNAPFDVDRWTKAVDAAEKYYVRKAAQQEEGQS